MSCVDLFLDIALDGNLDRLLENVGNNFLGCGFAPLKKTSILDRSVGENGRATTLARTMTNILMEMEGWIHAKRTS
jgi:hypothetical protein